MLPCSLISSPPRPLFEFTFTVVLRRVLVVVVLTSTGSSMQENETVATAALLTGLSGAESKLTATAAAKNRCLNCEKVHSIGVSRSRRTFCKPCLETPMNYSPDQFRVLAAREKELEAVEDNSMHRGCYLRLSKSAYPHIPFEDEIFFTPIYVDNPPNDNAKTVCYLFKTMPSESILSALGLRRYEPATDAHVLRPTGEVMCVRANSTNRNLLHVDQDRRMNSGTSE